eukprot:gene25337-10994_t
MHCLLSRSVRGVTVKPIQLRACAPRVRPTARMLPLRLHSRSGIVACASSPDGEEVEKSLNVTSALDDIARVVAENIFQIDTDFWMRMATRNDTAGSDEEKAKLTDRASKDTAESDEEKAELTDRASKVMLLVDAMVKKTEQQLEDSSSVLQNILTAAADDKGDWYLPLTTKQVGKVRATMARYGQQGQLDEALLSNAFSWINKCQEDKFDSMSQLIQKILQLYAGRELKGEELDGVEGVLNDIISAEPETWDAIIK